MRAILLVAFVFTTSLAVAQKSDDLGKRAKASHEQLLAAQTDGAANAAHPGDEEMTCEALQTEVMAITQNPQMLASVQARGADAQAQLDQINQAEQEARGAVRKGIFRSAVQGAATSAVPIFGRGAARAQQAAQAAQNAQAQVQAEKNIQSALAQGDELAANVGPMMRAQHLLELAKAHKCEWLQEPPGGETPSAPAPQGK